MKKREGALWYDKESGRYDIRFGLKESYGGLWDGQGNFVDDNTLSVYIRRLREKIEEQPSRPEHLLTVRGMGYRWEGEQ